MTLRLAGSTSGYTEIDAPAVAGSNTLVLPTGNGTNGQFLQGNGSGTLSWSGSLTLGTAQASTSGTSIDFTGIPSWVKRVTVMFDGMSTNGTSAPIIQLGKSAGIENTGYDSGSCYITNVVGTANSTAGFILSASHAASDIIYGNAYLTLLNASTNVWTMNGNSERNTGAALNLFSGRKALSGTLDRIRITTVNGTDTFDAGSINILYEG